MLQAEEATGVSNVIVKIYSIFFQFSMIKKTGTRTTFMMMVHDTALLKAKSEVKQAAFSQFRTNIQ